MATTKRVPLAGMEMFVSQQGAGTPLLLAHGFTGTSQNWSLFGDAFRERYHLIVPDLRGHGRSTNPSGRFTHRQVARDLVALLDHLNLEKVDAIGISGGGNALLHLALAHPDRIGSMVLVSSTPRFPPQARAFMRGYTAERRSPEEWAQMRERHPGGDDQIRVLWSNIQSFADSEDDMNLTTEDLQQIQARTLIVAGDRDPLYPVALPVEMFQSIPNASLWILPDEGHTPVFGVWREAFTQAALRFLEHTPAPG